jgi:SAM-dependent methyltransferase
VAFQGDGIGYAAGEAGAAPLPAGSVDLVTVAQALHWFAGEAFFAEVRRVAAPGAVLAAWSYALPSLGGDVAEAAMLRFYADVVGPYWPPERRLVMEGYRSLELPFDEIAPPSFEMTADWSLDRFLGLLRSWSASARFLSARGFDPVDDLARELRHLWGEAGAVRRISWPLTVRAMRV